MNDATELYAYELRRHHTGPVDDRVTRDRTALLASRRRERRSRLARRVRAVADRLES